MKSQVLMLRCPFSMNEMYWNNKGSGKGRTKITAAKAWDEEACQEIMAQKIRPITGKCGILIEIGERRTKSNALNRSWDLPNYNKQIPDVLVKMRIIKDDSVRYLTGINMEYVPSVEGVRVTITEREADD